MLEAGICKRETPVLRYLTDDQMGRVHFMSLEVLERIGVRVLHPEALDMLRDAGAWVSGDRVKIPEFLVKKALGSAPSRVVLADRQGRRRFYLEGRRAYFGTGSCCPYFIDPFSGLRRESTKQDTGDAAKMVDALCNLDFAMSLALVRASDPALGYLHEFDAMVRNTIKPIIVSCADGKNAQTIIEMASIVAGGTDCLKEASFLAVYSEITSPLIHSRDGLEKVFACADSQIPIVYTVGMLAGATGPVTIEGALVQANAEVLSGLVIHQLRRPGAPFIYGGTITPMDMKTMIHPYGAPEFHVFSALFAELGSRYYHLPVFSTGGCSDSKTFDEQAAAEATYSLVLATLSGGNLIHDIGYLDGGLTGCLSMLVLADEVIEAIKHMIVSVDTDYSALPLDLIADVGPGGHYLDKEHTLQNFRRIFVPQRFDRGSYRLWQEHGSKSLSERLEDEVRRTLGDHEVPPLPEEVSRALDEVIERNARNVA